MSAVISKSNAHIVLFVLGLFVYVIAVGTSLLAGEYVCDEHTFVLTMCSMAIMFLGSITGFINALIKRSKKIAIQGACLGLLVFALYLVFYNLATQCPGW